MLRKPLRAIEGWCVTPSYLHSLQRLLLYRPLLALFLTLRILVDTWDSMFFEVGSSTIQVKPMLTENPGLVAHYQLRLGCSAFVQHRESLSR